MIILLYKTFCESILSRGQPVAYLGFPPRGFGINETLNKTKNQFELLENKIHQFKFEITTDKYENNFLNYKKKN